jgi:hypothetical protein
VKAGIVLPQTNKEYSVPFEIVALSCVLLRGVNGCHVLPFTMNRQNPTPILLQIVSIRICVLCGHRAEQDNDQHGKHVKHSV